MTTATRPASRESSSRVAAKRTVASAGRGAEAAPAEASAVRSTSAARVFINQPLPQKGVLTVGAPVVYPNQPMRSRTMKGFLAVECRSPVGCMTRLAANSTVKNHGAGGAGGEHVRRPVHTAGGAIPVLHRAERGLMLVIPDNVLPPGQPHAHLRLVRLRAFLEDRMEQAEVETTRSRPTTTAAARCWPSSGRARSASRP